MNDLTKIGASHLSRAATSTSDNPPPLRSSTIASPQTPICLGSQSGPLSAGRRSRSSSSMKTSACPAPPCRTQRLRAAHADVALRHVGIVLGLEVLAPRPQ